MGLGLKIKELRTKDSEKVVELYNKFARQYISMVYRTIDDFKYLLRKRPLDLRIGCFIEEKLVGYALGEYHAIFKEGKILEVVIDPGYNFEDIASKLISKLISNLSKRHPCVIFSKCIANYPTGSILEKTKFENVGLNKTIMLAIVDEDKFFQEVVQILRMRIKKKKIKEGIVLKCEKRKVTLKEGRPKAEIEINNIRQLATLMFGIEHADIIKTAKPNIVKILFPSKQFMTIDFW